MAPRTSNPPHIRQRPSNSDTMTNHLLFSARLRSAISPLFATAAVALASTVAFGKPPQTSTLQIEKSGATPVASARVYESPDRLIITGKLKKQPSVPSPARVEILLLDKGGRIIARQTDSVTFHHPRHRPFGAPFAASFPIEETRRASKVIVLTSPSNPRAQ